MRYLSLAEALELHRLAIERTGGAGGVRDQVRSMRIRADPGGWVLECQDLQNKIEAAEKDFQEGRVLSHESVVAETKRWFEE